MPAKSPRPDTLTVHFEFEQLPVVWRHRLWGATEYDPAVNNGIFLYGDEATIFASDRKWVLIPRDASDKREEHDVPSGSRNVAHGRLAEDAVRTGSPLACPVEEGFRSTATVQLGMIAYESNSVVAVGRSCRSDPGESGCRRTAETRVPCPTSIRIRKPSTGLTSGVSFE
jgi:hypothetical protein